MNATRKRVAFLFKIFEKLSQKVLTTQEKYAIIYTSNKQMLVPVRRRTVRMKHSSTKHRERNYRRHLQNDGEDAISSLGVSKLVKWNLRNSQHLHMPIWRNRQTRCVQGAVRAISCKFDSCYRHHQLSNISVPRSHAAKTESAGYAEE